MNRTITLPDGARVPILGQGTWRLGDDAGRRADEIRALREGLDRGLSLIDTAEMYGDGRSERLVGEAIAGRRDDAFLVSKIVPSNARRPDAIRRACRQSLLRLGTDRIDLYLLHWRGGEDLGTVVETFEALREAGDILRWGVSNFDVDDLAELDGFASGARVTTDQVLYNPEARGIEFDLLPACRERLLPVMAYSPVGQGGALLDHAALVAIARRHGVTPAAVALAWVLRSDGIIAIPKAGTVVHLRENVASLDLVLDGDDIERIDRAFPPPGSKRTLEML